MTTEAPGGSAVAWAAPLPAPPQAAPPQQQPEQPAAQPAHSQDAAAASTEPGAPPTLGAEAEEPAPRGAAPHALASLAKRRPGRPSAFVTADGNPACQCCGADLTQGGHKSFHQVRPIDRRCGSCTAGCAAAPATAPATPLLPHGPPWAAARQLASMLWLRSRGCAEGQQAQILRRTALQRRGCTNVSPLPPAAPLSSLPAISRVQHAYDGRDCGARRHAAALLPASEPQWG